MLLTFLYFTGWFGGHAIAYSGGFGGGSSSSGESSGAGGGYSGGGGAFCNALNRSGGGGSFCNSSLAPAHNCKKITGGNMEHDGLVTISFVV